MSHSAKPASDVGSTAADAPGQRVIHQHPLAYLLGLQGVALLRAFTGDYDIEFIDDRLAEILDLLDSAEQLGDGGALAPISYVAGYNGWATYYDQPGNAMIDREQPIVREILDELPVGVALDAACGTGRHAAYLASLGHDVIGVDSSPVMLAKARVKVPDAQFHEADLHRLPIPTITSTSWCVPWPSGTSPIWLRYWPSSSECYGVAGTW